MAGYSGTPLIKKLGLKAGHRVAIINERRGFRELLGELPEGLSIHSRLSGKFDCVLLFALSSLELDAKFADAAKAIKPEGMVWVAWPKKTSGVQTDLGEGLVQQAGLATGLVDTKICAIDDTWSGLKFMVRLKDRPK